MRIGNLEELRKVQIEIKNQAEKDNNETTQIMERMIYDTIKKMLELHRIARREGLLALEEAVENISTTSSEEVIKQLIMLVLDGAQRKEVLGIGWSRYYSNLYRDYRALQHLIYLEGVLSIQAGDGIRVLEEKLKSMLPVKMYLEFTYEKELERKAEEKKKDENLIENLCKGERLWNIKDSGYFVSKLLDYVICDIKDKDLQRVMREIDNMVLALAMKGMNGTARKHIFDNLSKRLGKMIAEDMTQMGPVRAVDILDASQTMLNVIIRLLENGEIKERYDYLLPFYDVVSVDTGGQREKNEKLEGLKKLVKEYEQASDMVKEFV